MMSENMWHSYTGILLNRKEKKMSLAGKWIEVDIVILNLISQTQKYCMFIFMQNLNFCVRIHVCVCDMYI